MKKALAYTPGYAEPTIGFMRRRSLLTHGAFVLPYLAPGKKLVDLGCGPGSITLDLARHVGVRGEVLGVDQFPAQFAQAEREAQVQGLPVKFQSMDVTDLKLDPDSFDGAFAHALLEHVPDPRLILRQIFKILKPGGFVALRSPDWGGFVLFPSSESLQRAIQARRDLQTGNGGDVFVGRKFRALLTEIGFTNVTPSASYEIYDDNKWIVEHLSDQLEAVHLPDHAKTIRQWGADPNSLFAQSWFEAIGFK